MEGIPRQQEEMVQEPQTLWHQLTPQQREQIAVVVLRILRQWQKHTQLQEVGNEPAKMDL